MSFHYKLHGADLHDAKAHAAVGSPIGSYAADVIGLIYFDLATNAAWVSTGLTNLDWVPLIGDESLFQINGEATTLDICTPVYSSSAGTVKQAKADNQAKAVVLGLVADVTIVSTISGRVQADGTLTATTAQWDVVTGLVGGLTPNAVYYLDPFTSGRITTTPPQENVDLGKYVSVVGQALNTTSFEIRIQTPILL